MGLGFCYVVALNGSNVLQIFDVFVELWVQSHMLGPDRKPFHVFFFFGNDDRK
jgi:hypothetical protein